MSQKQETEYVVSFLLSEFVLPTIFKYINAKFYYKSSETIRQSGNDHLIQANEDDLSWLEQRYENSLK